jgi:hypothetical protein
MLIFNVPAEHSAVGASIDIWKVQAVNLLCCEIENIEAALEDIQWRTQTLKMGSYVTVSLTWIESAVQCSLDPPDTSTP